MKHPPAQRTSTQSPGHKHFTFTVENIPELIPGFDDPLYHRSIGAAVASSSHNDALSVFVVSVRTDVMTASADEFESNKKDIIFKNSDEYLDSKPVLDHKNIKLKNLNEELINMIKI